MSAYENVFYQSQDGLTLYARDYPHTSPRATILCMHGLSRNSADFAKVCENLSDDYRLISIDQRGRGRSDYDADAENYNPQIYVQDMFTLLDHLKLDQVVAIGTSMGGIISMAMAATRANCFSGVVLNDIGPEIDPAGIERIRSYVGKLPEISSWEEAAAQVRGTNAIAFPDYTDADWLSFARNVYIESDDGKPILAHDPAIANALKEDNPPVDMWPLFDTMREAPMLVVRGATSDILAVDCVEKMQQRHPNLTSVEVPNRGHAPMLDEPQAVDALRRFLDSL